ncbi:uncharacterized protein LOC123549024 [Mercenaria mercenaria]|uniref:uncharacterized protein LOC123549024 n=1 Tax=Mercenaria mercenaria TaxID=6596 RepID=UPI00234EFFC1|nr:uncharacterized protein LOC123549024 [Mercenaria mercenaria]
MYEILEQAKKETIESGANPDSVTLVNKDAVALAYLPGNVTRIKMKVVGDLKIDSDSDKFIVPETVYQSETQTGLQTKKQTVTNTGVILSEDNNDTIRIESPNIDESTGEWLLSEYDINCLHIGAGILGCGGGGNPHLGHILAVSTLRKGKTIRVITPSRFFQNAHPQNDLVSLVAFMGAPVIMYEKLIAGNETVGALECLQDLYSVGGYKDGKLTNKDGVDIKMKDGVTYIDDYKANSGVKSESNTNMGDKKIVALMSAEIGGMNCIEPLIVGAALDLPVLDCDGMGRAFPELQMFTPFIYGNNPYPATLADDKGRRAAVLYADHPKSLENHFREVVISMGCSGGVRNRAGKDKVLVCVPDLITLMDADTAQPIPTEELRFGIRVAVVALRASPMISSEQALKFVGPQRFGYGDDVKYTPLCDFVDAGPVGPK